MKFVLIQGIGFIASLVGLSTYQVNNRKKILILQTIYNMIFGIQYLLLGSLNSLFMCTIAAIRNITFYFDEKYSKTTKNYMLIFFILLLILTTIFNWNGILSFLSCIGTVIFTAGIWQRNEKYIRMVSLVATAIWLVHDIIIVSYAAIIDEVLMLASITIGIYRFDVKKINKEDTAKQAI